MTRDQRFVTCNNLMDLMGKAKSKRVLQVYRRQLERCASRLKQKEQPQRTTA